MNEFIEAIPEDIRDSEHLAGIEDTGTLAAKFVEKMSTPPDFTSLLPEDLRENEALKDMDAGKLAASYLELQDKVPAVPDSPDKYNFDFPEDIPFDEASHKLFKEFAFNEGLTQQQFERLNEFDIKRIAGVMESFEAKRKESWEQIRQETGLEEAEIEKRIESVSEALGLGELAERLDLRADPDFVKAMLTIKDKISEDVLKSGIPGSKERPRGVDGQPVIVFKDMPAPQP